MFQFNTLRQSKILLSYSQVSKIKSCLFGQRETTPVCFSAYYEYYEVPEELPVAFLFFFFSLLMGFSVLFYMDILYWVLRLKTIISLTEKQMVAGDPQQDLLSVAILCICGIFPFSVKVADNFKKLNFCYKTKTLKEYTECTVLVRDFFISSMFMWGILHSLFW